MKVAIVGTAETRIWAPYADESWEVWAQNMAPGVHRWNRWFEVHDLDKLPSPDWDGLRSHLFSLDGSRPVYMRDVHPKVPGSIPYPLQKIRSRFGPQPLTSTMAFAVALAIDEMVPEGEIALKGEHAIGLFGIECAMKGEYEYQRPGLHQLLGVARALNIDVQLPLASDLYAPTRVYELQPPTKMEQKLIQKRSIYEEHHRRAVETFETAKAQKLDAEGKMREQEIAIAELSGMIDMLNYQLENGWWQ